MRKIGDKNAEYLRRDPFRIDGTVLREGRLRFDRLETRKAIYVDEYDCDILIEISGVQNVARGENSFRFRKSGRKTAV